MTKQLSREDDYKLRLLLRSVYLKGQVDANKKTSDISWEDKIVEDITLLFAGSIVPKEHKAEGYCPACGKVVYAPKEEAPKELTVDDISREIYDMLLYLPAGIQNEKDIEAIATVLHSKIYGKERT